MKALTKILLVVALVAGLSVPALAGSSDTQSVTVTVSAVNEISATGTVTLTINTATAGSDLDSDVDSSTADLLWTTNEASKKITIETDQASPTFTLKAVAQTVTGGTAASEVTVSDTAADFVTGIATTTGGCDIQYTGEATASQGTGSDVHTITYTVTAA